MKLEPVIQQDGTPQWLASGKYGGISILAYAPSRTESRLLFLEQVEQRVELLKRDIKAKQREAIAAEIRAEFLATTDNQRGWRVV